MLFFFLPHAYLCGLFYSISLLFYLGTNPAAMYLSANCYMANNTSDKAGHGMRWQVRKYLERHHHHPLGPSWIR
jgi:hypothetical protein